MIPGIELVDFIKWAGLFGIIAVIFAESGLLVGFFLPGDTLLFTAGYLAYAGLLPVNIHVLVLCVFAAAVLGDTVGYTFGYRVGRRLYQRKESRLFKKSHLEAAEKFYEKYGGKTIIFARFLPAVSTFAPNVAGTSNMSYRKFLAYNVIGAFLWAVLITYLGYYLGQWFHSMGLEIDQVLLPSLAVILVIGWTPAFIHLAQNPEQRKALWRMAKRQLKQLYGIDDQDNKSRK